MEHRFLLLLFFVCYTCATDYNETNRADPECVGYNCDNGILNKDCECTCYNGWYGEECFTQSPCSASNSTLTSSVNMLTGCLVIITAIGGTPPYYLSVSNGALQQSLSSFRISLPAGNYSYFISDFWGCQINNSFVSTSQLTVEVSVTNETCAGSKDGTANITVLGGVPPYKFKVGNGNSFEEKNYFTNLSPSDISFIVEDANNCSTSSFFTIKGPAEIKVSHNVIGTCFDIYGGSIFGTVQGGAGAPYYVSIDGGEFISTSNFNFTSLQQGSHEIIAKDGRNCTRISSVFIPSPTVSGTASKNGEFCEGQQGSIKISVSSGNGVYEYKLVSISSDYTTIRFSTFDTFSLLEPGIYTPYISDNTSGCVAVLPQIDLRPLELSYTYDIAASCNGSKAFWVVTLNATGGSGSYHYSFGSSFSTNKVFQAENGTYIVSIRDRYHFCEFRNSIELPSLPPSLLVEATIERESCENSAMGVVSFIPSGGVGNYTGKLSVEDTFGDSFRRDNLEAGNYTFIINDGNYCSAEINFTVTALPHVQPNVIVKEMECGDTVGTVKFIPTGPLFKVSFDGGPFMEQLTYTSLSNKTYNFIVTDSSNCSTSSSIDVITKPNIEFTFERTTTICFEGNTANVTFNVFRGTPPYQFMVDQREWQDDSLIMGLSSGFHNFIIRDRHGCNVSTSIEIISPTDMTEQWDIPETCSGGAFIYINGPTAFYSYSIDNGANYQSSNAFSPIRAGNLSVLVKSENGCQKEFHKFIDHDIELFVKPLVTASSCDIPLGTVFLNSTSLHSNASLQYSLDGGITFSSKNDFYNLGPGKYLFSVKDDNGCLQEGEALVIDTNRNFFEMSENIETSNCFENGATVTLEINGEGPFMYSTNRENFTSEKTFLNVPEGLNKFYVRYRNNCTAVSYVKVQLPPKLIVNTTIIAPKCHGESGTLMLHASGGTGTYSYRVGREISIDNVFSGLPPGIIDWFVADALSCQVANYSIIPNPTAITVSAIVKRSCSSTKPDGQITFIVTGGTPPYLYSVDSINYTDQHLYYDLENGTVEYSILDSNGCMNNGTLFIDLDLDPKCSDVDECSDPQLNTCIPPSICRNSIGNFVCREDAASCSVRNGGCDYRVTCTDIATGPLCGACPLGTIGYGNSSCNNLCRNGVCDEIEDCISCPDDCGFTDCKLCGNGICDEGENCSCVDCGPCGIPLCEGGCSGHGNCSERGVCLCFGSWTGPYCNSSQNNPIIANFDSDYPSISIASSTTKGEAKIQIAIQKFVEISSVSGNEVRSVSFSDINFSFYSTEVGPNKLYNYVSTLDNGAFLNITIWQFSEETEIEFANITTIYQPHILKLTAKIQNWPFFSISNSLAIITNSNLDLEQNINSNNNVKEEQKTKVDERGSLIWAMFKIDGVSLYGQFLERAIIDGRVKTISNELRSDGTVAILLPHFWFDAELDPNFSVLVDRDNGEGDGGDDGGEGKNKDKREKDNTKMILILIAVFVTIGVILLFFVSAFFVYPRVKLWWQIKRTDKITKVTEMQRLDTSESIDSPNL